MAVLSCLWIVTFLAARLLSHQCCAFLFSPHFRQHTFCASTSIYASKYVPPELAYGEDSSLSNAKTTAKPLYPKVGDIVRYYDLDGGKADGQVLVGKITFIQERLDAAKSSNSNSSRWLVEVTELDDLGDGFRGDFPARQRQQKRTLRDLTAVSPISASFVRVENAYRIPVEAKTGRPKVRAETYDIEGYLGPFKDPENTIDQTVLEQDAVIYAAFKNKLLSYVAIAGLIGTIAADLLRGFETAIIYAGGVLASIVYLLLLSLKTDTIGVRTEAAKIARNLSALRFVMPLLVLVVVALYDRSLGDASPIPKDHGLFDTVTKEQFAAAALGFVTYRAPLFLIQVQEAFRDASGDTKLAVPGSAGIAMQLLGSELDQASTKNTTASSESNTLSTVLLVSGPQATGRSDLVRRLVTEGQGRYVALEPSVDRVKDGAAFERLDQRKELLLVDPTGRFGWTKTGIQSAAKRASEKTISNQNDNNDSVIVVDANVEFAKQLTTVPGLRLVGVWVGLKTMAEFENRLNAEIDAGNILIPQDETRDSVMRARIRQIVKEIEFGISSGIFEFTILNEDKEEGLKQLREAASYCFR